MNLDGCLAWMAVHNGHLETVFINVCRDLVCEERQIHDGLLEEGMKDGDRITVFKVLLACGNFLFLVRRMLQEPKK